MSIPLNIGSLPNNFCPATYQQMLNGFGAALSVTIPAGSGGIVISPTKPTNTSSVWFQIDLLGRFQRMYLFGQGAWLSAHPLIAGSTVWWFNSLPNFSTFDGGDASATVGPASGAMWRQALDYNGNLIAAKFVLTPGTLPSTAVVSIGDSGGEETHLLTSLEGAQDPLHQHLVGRFKGASGTDGTYGYFHYEASSLLASAVSGQLIQGGGTFTQSADISSVLTGNYIKTSVVDPAAASVTPHNNMSPYVTGFLLQRTSRIFYAVT